MSRLLSLSLLLVLLAELYCSAAMHANFQVSKVHIRKCRCQVLPDGRTHCLKPYVKPMTQKELLKCICSKANRTKFPEFQTACKSLNFVRSTPL